MGSKGGGGRVRLLDVDTRKLLGLKYKLICLFQIDGRHGRGGFREFVKDTDGPAFLERELMGLGVDGYQLVRVYDRASEWVPI